MGCRRSGLAQVFDPNTFTGQLTIAVLATVIVRVILGPASLTPPPIASGLRRSALQSATTTTEERTSAGPRFVRAALLAT